MPTKRNTIPYGVDPEAPRSSGPRRRASMAAPRVSPLPERLDDVLVLGETDEPSPTAVTQPMPAVKLGSRPAIPPPRMPTAEEIAETKPPPPPTSSATQVASSHPPASGPLSERSRKRALREAPGVYRFTAPPSDRKKKR